MNFNILRKTINEAATCKVETGIHEFFGGITESCNEFNLMMNESCGELDCDIRVGNEILVEAATSGATETQCRVINESIFGNVIDKIKEFFKKIVEYIKGIINKIKLYAAGLSTNTDKWYNKMKEAVKTAATNKDITKSFEWEGYNWNEAEITGIKDLAEKVADIKASFGIMAVGVSEKSKIGISDVDSHMKETIAAYEKAVKEFNTTTKTESGAVAAMSKNKDALNKEIEKAVADYKDAVKAAIGLTGNMDGYKGAITDKVHGSKTVRPLKGIDGKYSGMLTYIEKCSDTLSDVADAYEKTKDVYQKALDYLESESSAADFTEVDNIDKDNREALDAAKEVFSKVISTTKTVITYGQGIYNGLCSLQLSLTKDCAQSYMKVLTKLALAKPSK